MSDQRWIVLDTDVWSGLFTRSPRKPDPRLGVWRRLIDGASTAIAMQTRAEVLAGLAYTDLGQQRRAAIRIQLDATPTIPVSEDVVIAFADLTAGCRMVGHALHAKTHTADRWIAATAIAVGYPLLAGDHIYSDAPGLRLLTSES
ncbi:MAG: PIN domain-containing protein [Promicromonosporaceae bacterium]|nr:PIN domain-containing protein [Promicromonosporaceae bacterium]